MWHQIIYGIKSGMKTANEQNAAPMFFEKHIEPTARTVWKAPRQTGICHLLCSMIKCAHE